MMLQRSPGPDGNCSFDCDRGGQVGGGNCAHQTRTWGVVAAVKEGRITFQRILTYTLNSVSKKVVQVLFLAAGLIMTGHAILTPMLMVIVMITGDFLGMSLTTDNVSSPTPCEWRVGSLRLQASSWEYPNWFSPHCRTGRRKVPPGIRIGDTENACLRGHCVRQSSNNLYESHSSMSLVDPPKRLVGDFFARRFADRLNDGEPRNRDGASIITRARSNAGWCSCVFAVVVDLLKFPYSIASGSFNPQCRNGRL